MPAASPAEINVACSGAFKAAYLALVPQFETASGRKVATSWGASIGDAPTSIPSRLARREPLDLVILSADSLDRQIAAGRIIAGSRVDLVRTGIGVAVKAGAPRPDIGSADALVRALLQARSVGYSASASGVYLEGLCSDASASPTRWLPSSGARKASPSASWSRAARSRSASSR